MTEPVSIQIINYENETEEEIIELYQKPNYSEEELFNSFHICICSENRICCQNENTFIKCKNFNAFIKKHPYIEKIYNSDKEIEFLKETVKTKVTYIEINRTINYIMRLNMVMKDRNNRGYCKIAMIHFCLSNVQSLFDKNLALNIRNTLKYIIMDEEYCLQMKENNIDSQVWMNILEEIIKK